MLEVASIQFFSLFEQINNFKITAGDLELINKNREYFLILTRILLDLQECGDSVHNITIKLDSCLIMYKWILEQINLLTYFNNFMDNIHNINSEMLSAFLSLKKECIGDICCLDGNTYIFADSPDINAIITFPQYVSMCSACITLPDSRIIIRVFDQFINEKGISIQTPFDIKIFYEEIWKPAYDFSINLLNKFRSETILISEMFNYFDGTESFDTILKDLIALDYSCMQIQTDDFFLTCANIIYLYSDLQQCSDGANLIIKPKNELRLVVTLK